MAEPFHFLTFALQFFINTLSVYGPEYKTPSSMTEEKKSNQEEVQNEESNQLNDQASAPADSNAEKEAPASAPSAESTEAEISTTVEQTESSQNAEPEEEKVVVAHDDFDWSIKKNQTHSYKADEYETMLSDYDSTFSDINEFEVVQGKVVAIRDGDVILDINYKSNGVISLSEFREIDDLKVGDPVDVYVERKEDENGQLVLSRRKARLLKTWDALTDSYNNDTIIKGTIVSKTKGGLIVDVNGLETFLPGSQIDIKPIIDYDSYVGKTMEFKVVKINEAIKNAVVSHKALIESDLAEQRDQIIQSLEKGQVLEGVVKNLTDFGAFMDLGGIDGLLYITDISWGRIGHPSEVLELNQKINVVVLDFDENKKRISLGLKQLQPHPWDVLDETVIEGSKVKGTIVNIEDYGAFLEIVPGVEGLIHVSEVSWSNQPVNAREFFDLGQEHEAIVVTIDREDRKMSLSLKQLTEDPWNEIDQKYPIGSRQTGEVKNLTPYGVFVELDEGIGGMVHISDLSWTKRYSHPSEFTSVGDDLEIVILEIDKEDRKLTLGHKQIEENPWDTFEKVFPVGSYHDATIIRIHDRGAIVQMPYGLEAFAPIKHIRKEDGTMGQVDEVMTFKVLEFNRDDKRILVSHLRYLEDIQRESLQKVKSEKQQQQVETRQTIQQQQKKIERTTLGDLSSLAELRSQLSGESEEE